MKIETAFVRTILMIALFAFQPLFAKEKWGDEARLRKADYIFMEAQRQSALDNEDAYFELLNRSYGLDPSSSDAGFYLGYYKLAMSDGDSLLFNQGYNLMGEYFKKTPEDFYASYLYGNINEKIGNRKRAIEVWSTLDSIYPEKTEIAIKHAEILCSENDSTELMDAIRIYERIETIEGKNVPISTRKIRAYFTLRDTTAIENEVSSLLASSPHSAEFNVFAADICSIFNKPDSALYYYDRACELDSTSGLAYYSRANFYKQRGDSVAYDREVFKALKLESLDLQTKLGLLTNYIKALYEDPDQQSRIEDLFAVLLEQHPHESEIHELYCSYLVAIKDYSGAAEQAGYVVDANPGDADRWRAVMSLYMQADDYVKATETGDKALQCHPDNSLIYLLLASAYGQLDQYDKAIPYLNESLRLVDSLDYELKSSVLTTLGDMYYQKEMSDSAFLYYDEALTLNPKNLLALNNCAYYLACEGKDLDRAERMSAITIKEEPENDTSLDTYAWILFKKKDYERAKHYIDEALSYSESPSHELYHHAGDIYFMSGDPDKAFEFWKKALELSPDDELLQRKVKHKTYFYK